MMKKDEASACAGLVPEPLVFHGQLCSFCGTTATDPPLVPGLGAMICAGCLSRLQLVASAPKSDRLAVPVPSVDQMTKAELLEAFDTAIAARDQANHFLRHWVQVMRRHNVSWAAIGAAMGTSRQAAWERFHVDAAVVAAIDADQVAR